MFFCCSNCLLNLPLASVPLLACCDILRSAAFALASRSASDVPAVPVAACEDDGAAPPNLLPVSTLAVALEAAVAGDGLLSVLPSPWKVFVVEKQEPIVGAVIRADD